MNIKSSLTPATFLVVALSVALFSRMAAAKENGAPPLNVGTDPIMINMVKDAVEGSLITDGGAFAVFYNQPTATIRTVTMSIDSTSSSSNGTGKFETLVSTVQSPVTSPLRLRRDTIVRLKGGELLTEATTVYGQIKVLENSTVLQTENYQVTFTP